MHSSHECGAYALVTIIGLLLGCFLSRLYEVLHFIYWMVIAAISARTMTYTLALNVQ
jgi:hypothetical protein